MRKKIYVVFACLLTNILGLHAAAQPSSSQDREFVAPQRYIPSLFQLAMQASATQPAQIAENLAFIESHSDLRYLPAQTISNVLLARIGGQFRKVGSFGGSLGTLNANGTKYASLRNAEIWEWDLVFKMLIHRLSDEGDYYYAPGASAVRFSDDDTKLAGGFFDGSIRVWDAQTGELEIVRGVQRLDNNPSFAVAISPDNTKIAAGTEDGIIRVWDVAREDPLYVIRENARTIYALAFSPDGSMLVSSDDTPTVKLRKAANGELLHEFSNKAFALAFNPAGNMLASGLYNTISLLDPYAGTLLSTLSGHTDSIRSLAFSPDGMLLASGSDDKTVKLWRPKIKEPLHTLTGLKMPAISLAFSSDGTRLTAGLENGDVVEWELGYQKDLQQITDTQELRFLLHAAQHWLAGKTYDVDVSDPVYQSLVARFAYLQDKRLFTLHGGALEQQVAQQIDDLKKFAEQYNAIDANLTNRVLHTYDAYYDFHKKMGEDKGKIFEDFKSLFIRPIRSRVLFAIMRDENAFSQHYAAGRAIRDQERASSSSSTSVSSLADAVDESESLKEIVSDDIHELR